MNVKVVIEEIKKSLQENINYFKHKNIMFIGENNSGKSKIIKTLLTDLLEKEQNIYFIDSPNRNIPTKREDIHIGFDQLNLNEIVENRIKDKYFNREDVFDENHRKEIVLIELMKNFEHYQSIFKEILSIELTQEKNKKENDMRDIILSEENSILLDGEEMEFASDAQDAMMRILMEVDFAYRKDCRLIFIDEFDINLDHKNSSDFIEKLKFEYPDMRFIIAAHSLYTVLGVQDFDVIKIIKNYDLIDKNLCEKFDSNDLDNIGIIDKKLFSRINEENAIDILLSNTLKDIVIGKQITEESQKEIETISNLSIRQKVILEYIKERLK